MGDAADALGQPAAAYYREAQGVLLPAGVVWTDREAYDRRMEMFQQVQQKLYRLSGAGKPRDLPGSSVPSRSEPEVPAAPDSESKGIARATTGISVGQFVPGLIVRVVQDFVDYDGQEIRAGEVLRFVDSSYFPYEGGFTLRFAEKTIRLAYIVDEEQVVIENAGNAWFQPLDGEGRG